MSCRCGAFPRIFRPERASRRPESARNVLCWRYTFEWRRQPRHGGLICSLERPDNEGNRLRGRAKTSCRPVRSKRATSGRTDKHTSSQPLGTLNRSKCGGSRTRRMHSGAPLWPRRVRGRLCMAGLLRLPRRAAGKSLFDGAVRGWGGAGSGPDVSLQHRLIST